MAVFLNDAEIARLLAERKPVSADFFARIVPRPKRGHKGCELAVSAEGGSNFTVMVRQSVLNPLDFSVILAVEPKGSTQRFLLRRYNGKSHEHSNPLEKQGPFYDYHIHTATERYQSAGMKEEHFAEPTGRYADWRAAVECLVADCAIILPPGEASLFPSI